MGVVFLARHEALGREVALKYLVSEDEEVRGRFKREGRILAQLKHPNIVEVFAAEVIDGTPILACEFVEGEDLRSWIRREGPAAAAERGFEIAEHILDALECAHEAGIVHRDLKSENVLLSRKGETKLADFGIAATQESGTVKTRAGQVFGTPAYMAPEQIDSMSVDARADLYSFGVILFEMFAGKLPFDHPDLMQLLKMQHMSTPPRPERVAAWIPLSLSAVILRLLEKNPAARFGSAAETREALRAIPEEDRRFLRLKASGASSRSPAIPEADTAVRDPAPRTRSTGASKTVVPRRTLSVPAAVPSGGGRARLAGIIAALAVLATVAGAAMWSSRPVPAPPSTVPSAASVDPDPRGSGEPGAVSVLEHQFLVTDAHVHFLALLSRPATLKLRMIPLHEDDVPVVTEGKSREPAVWQAVSLERKGTMLEKGSVRIEIQRWSRPEPVNPGTFTLEVAGKDAIQQKISQYLSTKAGIDELTAMVRSQAEISRHLTHDGVVPAEIYFVTNKEDPRSGLLLRLLREQSIKQELLDWDQVAEHHRGNRESNFGSLARVAGIVGSCHPDARTRNEVAEILRENLDLDGYPRFTPRIRNDETDEEKRVRERAELQTAFVSDLYDITADLVQALCLVQTDSEAEFQALYAFFEKGWIGTNKRFREMNNLRFSYRAIYFMAARNLARYRPEWAGRIAKALAKSPEPPVRGAGALMESMLPDGLQALETSVTRSGSGSDVEAQERSGALLGHLHSGRGPMSPELFGAWALRESKEMERICTGGLWEDLDVLQRAKEAYRRILLATALATPAPAPGVLGPLLAVIEKHRPIWPGSTVLPEDLPGDSRTFERTMILFEGRLMRTLAFTGQPEAHELLASRIASKHRYLARELLRGFIDREIAHGAAGRGAGWAGTEKRIRDFIAAELPAGATADELCRRDPHGGLVMAAAVLGIPGWEGWAVKHAGQGSRWLAWVGMLALEGAGTLFGSRAAVPLSLGSEAPTWKRGMQSRLREFFEASRKDGGSSRSRWVILDTSLPWRSCGLSVEVGEKVRTRSIGLAFPSCQDQKMEYDQIRLDRGDPAEKRVNLSYAGGVRIGARAGRFEVDLPPDHLSTKQFENVAWEFEATDAGDLRMMSWMEKHGAFERTDEENTALTMQHEGMVLVKVMVGE